MKVLMIHGATVFDNIGGSEIQLDHIAQYLMRNGHQVIFYTMNLGREQQPVECISGYKIYRNNAIGPSPLMPYKHQKIILKIIEEEKPDIMYARCLRTTYIANMVSKKTGLPFVYQLPFAFSHDIFSFKSMINNIRKFKFNALNAILSPMYIQKAACLMALCKEDAGALADFLKVKTTSIYNMHTVPDIERKNVEHHRVVWINNLKPIKRPEMFIELALRCASMDAEFIMAGAPGAGEYGKEMMDLINSTSNLRYLGAISFDEVNQLLETSSINVLTSRSEGFGNSNIQGWMRLVPIVTTVDRDNVVVSHDLGYKVNTTDELVEKVQYLLTHPEVLSEMGLRARDYAINNHSINANGAKYEDLFKKVIAKQYISE